MPAISVRDIQVKDDSTCLCGDLIAGTHGRGFWILDDVSPLRQMAEVRAAGTPYLVKPQTAVRVRFGTNEPPRGRPSLPAGQNPPAGAILDYFLPQDVPGEVTLQILDATGHVIRAYSSADSVLEPDPAVDPVAYDRVCRQKPNASDCGLPLYWRAPGSVSRPNAGLHRTADAIVCNRVDSRIRLEHRIGARIRADDVTRGVQNLQRHLAWDSCGRK